MADHKAILITNSEVDPELDEAYNKWYTEVHIPDCLMAKYWQKATRYRIVPPHSAPANQNPPTKYVTIWELGTDDVELAFRELGKVGEWIRENDRNFEPVKHRYRGTYVMMGEPQYGTYKEESATTA